MKKQKPFIQRIRTYFPLLSSLAPFGLFIYYFFSAVSALSAVKIRKKAPAGFPPGLGAGRIQNLVGGLHFNDFGRLGSFRSVGNLEFHFLTFG
jgi:hypothetical protein